MRKAITFAAAAAAAVSLPACNAVVENRVEKALVDAGVPPGLAGCMAPIWTERLTVAQLRGIQQFANDVRAEGGQLTAAKLIDHARSWNDPDALLVVTTSAGRCAFR